MSTVLSRCASCFGIAAASVLSINPTARAEDSGSFRPYLQLRSAAFNENWGAQDGWGLTLGANLNSYLSFELGYDVFEQNVEWPNLDNIFESSISSITPQIRLRYPLAEGKWVPYAFAGPGVTFLQLNDRKEPAFHRDVQGDSTQFSVVSGVGLEYFVADNISFSIEGKYNWVQPGAVTVDGERREIDFSSPLVMLGVRAYFRENKHRELLREKPGTEFPGRFWGGFRYGSSILLDHRLNADLRLEPLAAALGDVANQSGSFLLGYNLGKHLGFGVTANYAEYILASDTFGKFGEYSTYSIFPEARWRWTLWDGKLSPFISTGVGVTYAEFNDRKPPGEFLKVDASGFYPAADLGAGAEYFFARNISVSAEGHYATSWGHKFSVNGAEGGKGTFSTLNLYLGMRFYLTEH